MCWAKYTFWLYIPDNISDYECIIRMYILLNTYLLEKNTVSQSQEYVEI